MSQNNIWKYFLQFKAILLEKRVSFKNKKTQLIKILITIKLIQTFLLQTSLAIDIAYKKGEVI